LIEHYRLTFPTSFNPDTSDRLNDVTDSTCEPIEMFRQIAELADLIFVQTTGQIAFTLRNVF